MAERRKGNFLSGKGVLLAIMTIVSVFVCGLFRSGAAVQASGGHDVLYYNSDTGYEVILEDDAELLSESQRKLLAEDMEPITEYGNVAFKSIDYNSSSAARYAEAFYYDCFDDDSGTLFLIDMDNREIRIYSDGEIYRYLTKNYADTITDNVYTYASREEYYECASRAFEQIADLLHGKRIAQPMKYLCNAFLAVIVALLINYLFVSGRSRMRSASEQELLDSTTGRYQFTKPNVTYLNETKTYNPVSSGSSGGGGHRSGGGGGGHHSGGGGGHRF